MNAEDKTVSPAEIGTGILIVDDEPFICSMLSRWLAKEGYECAVANSADEALSCLAEKPYGLMVSDIMMPGKSGLELLEIVRKEYQQMAVLMATGVDQRETATRALELGAYGYMIKPFDKNEFLINVAGALERLRLVMQSQQYEKMLEQKVRDRTSAIRLREEEIALRLVWASEYRDDDTGEHIRRIGLFSAALARSLGWSSTAVDDIRVAAPMHDVGKIGIPDRILLKPGKLTDEEFGIIKSHTAIGAGILGDSDIPLLQFASRIALFHHEKWDGSGYPQGLAGEDIPEEARIVAIVDVYDALSNNRVYRPGFSEQKAIEIMDKGAGSHFDPLIYKEFIKVLPVFRELKGRRDGGKGGSF